MPCRRLLTVAVVCAVLLALVVACGGNDDNGGGATPGTTTSVATRTPTGDATAAASPDAQSTTAPTSSASDDATTAAREAGDRLEAASFTATYALTIEGDDEGTTNGTLTLYKGGSDRLRQDARGEDEGEELVIILIETPGRLVYCLAGAGALRDVLGGEGQEGLCYEDQPVERAGLVDVRGHIDRLQDEDLDVLDVTERTIAGRDATCIKGDAEGVESDVCVDDGGVLLYARSGDGIAIEATDVRGSPADADFNPPYEISDLPE